MGPINDSRCAFPCMPPQDTAAGVAVGYPYPEAGMTLREYAAIKIMAGLSANPSVFQKSDRCGFTLANATLDELVEVSAQLADSVLKACKGVS